eukprot:CAMPEP_0174271236 /NCGR_PEP_ID=MMETSP0439-20130205/47183_1 /TAXON_ID=0 /ORGANISM="Stereomyxa ramosa, Strain Chinc5" /LENGTH=358 /DNA_ID=CAMNT_0015361103 /DNA_START=45 /DNA_END=1121 /DNA_ORIENTATION=+
MDFANRMAMLGVMLQSKHQQNTTSTDEDKQKLKQFKEYTTEIRSTEPTSYLGKMPTDFESLTQIIQQIHQLQINDSPQWPAIEKWGGPEGVVKIIFEAYFDNIERKEKLENLYTEIFRRLGEEKEEQGSYSWHEMKIVAMVATGGTPWMSYGLGDDFHATVEAQIQLVLQFGFLFDIIPLQLFDFDSDIDLMSLATAAVLVAKLIARGADASLDAIWFACKGTQAVALAVQQFFFKHPEEKEVSLIGMGTDLALFYNGRTQIELTTETIRRKIPILVFNSKQDLNIGEYHMFETPKFKELEGSKRHEYVYYDIDSMLEWFKGVNPDHNWYDDALRFDSANPLGSRMLSLVSSFLDNHD